MQNTRLMESINIQPVAGSYTLEDLFTLSHSIEGAKSRDIQLRQMVENYKKGDRSVDLDTLCGVMEAHLFPEKVKVKEEKKSSAPATVSVTLVTGGKLDPFRTPIPERVLENYKVNTAVAALNESSFETLRTSCKGKQFFKRLAEYRDLDFIPEDTRGQFAKAITSAYTHMLIEADCSPEFKKVLDSVTPVFERTMFPAIRTGKVDSALKRIIQLVIKEA